MRPRGEIREALVKAAHDLHQERGAVTHRDLAERAQVGYEVARRTVDNMAEPGGDLVRTGRVLNDGRHWMTLFAPADSGAFSAAVDLERAMRSWCL